jgi:uncharacterized membrane protein
MFYQTLRKPMEYFYFLAYIAAALGAGFSVRDKNYQDMWCFVAISFLFFALWLEKVS